MVYGGIMGNQHGSRLLSQGRLRGYEEYTGNPHPYRGGKWFIRTQNKYHIPLYTLYIYYTT